MIHSLALLALQAPVVGEWTALGTPSICRAAPRDVQPPILADGSHLWLAGREESTADQASSTELALATFVQMLEEDARARGTKLEILRQAGATVVRGDANALAAARALSADLDRAGRAREVEVLIQCRAARADGTPQGFEITRRMISGETCFFGSREVRSYVAGFEVEVASDSGSSEPVLGRAFSGRGVHLRVARVDGGKRVFLWGVLDCAEIVEMKPFDPGTVDLGVIEEPHVEVAQAVFAGVVESGGTLTVSIAGTGLSTPELKLSIVARTTADPAAAESAGGADRGYAALDLAFLAEAIPELAPCDPGSAIAREAPPRAAESRAPALPPSAVAAMVETARGAGARGARAPLYWSDRMLFVPRSDPAALREARSIVAGIESARLATGRVEFALGPLEASLPVVDDVPARLLVGGERAFVVDYRLEIAPQIWMPTPTVETALDGTCLALAPLPRGVACSAWSARTSAVREIGREEAQIGRLQLLTRGACGGAAHVRADDREGARLDLSCAPGPARVRYVTP